MPVQDLIRSRLYIPRDCNERLNEDLCPRIRDFEIAEYVSNSIHAAISNVCLNEAYPGLFQTESSLGRIRLPEPDTCTARIGMLKYQIFERLTSSQFDESSFYICTINNTDLLTEQEGTVVEFCERRKITVSGLVAASMVVEQWNGAMDDLVFGFDGNGSSEVVRLLNANPYSEA